MSNIIYKDYDTTQSMPGKENFQWHLKYFRNFILPYIPQKKDVKIIDLGCGYGKYLKILELEGYKRLSGVDISEGQIRYAKNNFNLYSVYVGDALEFINNEKKSTDVIMLIDILEHLESSYAIQLITKAYEALVSGGKLIIQTPNGLSVMNLNIYGDFTHKRAFTTKSIGQILSLAGFQNYNHYSLPPYVHGLKSLIRRIIWSGIVNPFFNFYCLIQNGERSGGIFTPNILTIARR